MPLSKLIELLVGLDATTNDGEEPILVNGGLLRLSMREVEGTTSQVILDLDEKFSYEINRELGFHNMHAIGDAWL